MSHVDQGALHAYLDGALDELPSGVGRTIREHLATCPECTARLEEEKRIREHALAILSGPLPQVELPPLEELRLRAEATSPPRASRGWRIHRMGWAASVILAIGAGWMLRGGQALPFGTMDSIDGPNTLPVLEAPRLEARSAASDLDASARDLLRQALATESIVAEVDGGDPLVAEPVREVLLQKVRALDVVTLGDRLLDAPTHAPFEASALLDLTSVEVTASRLSGALSAPRVEALRFANEDFDEERAALRGRAAVTSASRSAAAAPFSTGDASVQLRERRQAMRRGGDEGQLVVPGFKLIGHENIEEGPAAGGLRTLQFLTSVDTLELLRLPEGVQPADLAAPEQDGIEQLEALRDGEWLIMRAPRSKQELEVLLERLDASR